jgi:hypothetical protein
LQFPASIRGVSLCLLPVVLSLLSAASSAQNCFPDGLQLGACATPATVRLPDFPGVSDRVRYVCFESCDPQIDQDLCYTLGAPRVAHLRNQPPIESIYLIRLTIETCSAHPRTVWMSNLRAQYCRNWLTAVGNPAGPVDTEVWRFLVNGNLAPSTFLSTRFANNARVLPPCTSQYPKPHFWGYVDYARNCATGQWQVSWAIQHDCDYWEHSSASVRPGSFHPNDSYTFVAPSGGFVVNSTTLAPAVGAIGADQDALRKNGWSSLPNVALGEETMVNGQVNFGVSSCPCTPAAGTFQFQQCTLIGTGSCNTRFQTILGAPVPFTQKRIGQWNRPAGSYPGQDSVLLTQGVMQIIDGTTNVGTVEYWKGIASVAGGASTRLSGTPLAGGFIDLGSTNSSPTDRTTLIGAKYVSNYLLNLNVQ